MVFSSTGRHDKRPPCFCQQCGMQPLYRYMAQRWADDFLRTGRIRFAPLAYYRDFEDAQVRGDQFEGTRYYRPEGGVVIDHKTQGSTGTAEGWAFEARANEHAIFALCMSTERSAELARRFQADACIEVHNPAGLISRLRGALALRQAIRDPLQHGCVLYLPDGHPPMHEWALPERTAMTKRDHFAWQAEYRICFAEGGAFGVNAVSTFLTRGDSREERMLPRKDEYQTRDFRFVTLGPMRRHCRKISIE